MGKRATWFACGVVAALPVAAGTIVDRLAGSVLFEPAGGVLGALYLVGTFLPNAPLFGRVAHARDDAGVFALTFDDGPDPRFSPQISRLLAGRGHHATFFVLGRHAHRHPELLRQILEDGNELASHGFDHRLLAFSTPSALSAQLAATEQALVAAVGRRPAGLFRPPHGVRSPWLARSVGRAGYRVCGWSGAVFDTSNPGVAKIVARCCRQLRPGAILLLHDGDGSGRGDERRQTVEALPAILDEAERRGLRSVCLSSVLEPPHQARTRPGRIPA